MCGCGCMHGEAMALGAFLMFFLIFSFVALAGAGNVLEVGFGSRDSKDKDEDS